MHTILYVIDGRIQRIRISVISRRTTTMLGRRYQKQLPANRVELSKLEGIGRHSVGSSRSNAVATDFVSPLKSDLMGHHGPFASDSLSNPLNSSCTESTDSGIDVISPTPSTEHQFLFPGGSEVKPEPKSSPEYSEQATDDDEEEGLDCLNVSKVYDEGDEFLLDERTVFDSESAWLVDQMDGLGMDEDECRLVEGSYDLIAPSCRTRAGATKPIPIRRKQVDGRRQFISSTPHDARSYSERPEGSLCYEAMLKMSAAARPDREHLFAASYKDPDNFWGDRRPILSCISSS